MPRRQSSGKGSRGRQRAELGGPGRDPGEGVGTGPDGGTCVAELTSRASEVWKTSMVVGTDLLPFRGDLGKEDSVLSPFVAQT